MSLSELLSRIVHLLDRLGVPYMVTGSLAAAYHGAPRSTQDIDLVVEIEAEKFRPLVEAVTDEGWYVDEESARAAVRDHGQFNVIEADTGWKVDFIIRKDRAFSREEFGRRRPVEALGRTVFMVTPEDLIIAKLEWARLGESERQLRDVRNILAVQEELDRSYIDLWTERLGLVESWRSVRTG